jgi:REP element-mobilizing transposase RayT
VGLKKESYLPGFNSKTVAVSHGGDLALGKRKIRRPIDPKQALHVVLRSSKAQGALSMLRPKNAEHIHQLTQKLSRRWGVRIYRYANVGNHIHLLVKVPSRAIWQRFIRELTGGIALIVTGAKKGAGLERNETGRGFWDRLVFTRIVGFGRDFNGVMQYLIKNLFEAAGLPMKRLLSQGFQLTTIRRDGRLANAPNN